MTDPDLAPRLRLTIARLARRLRQDAAPGLTPSQAAALASIERIGPCTLGDLARAERVRPPSITAVVGKLEEAGLAGRVTDPDDRRVTRVQCTAAGYEALDDIRRRKDEALERLLGALGAREQARLAAAVPILERLADLEAVSP